jgi:hypothetical protein
MRTTKHLTIGVLCVLAVMAVAALWLIGPNYREAAGIRAQVRELQARLAGLGDRSQAVERLAGDVDAARARSAADLKHIPESPDVAGLIRRLSYPIDGFTVADQTFTAGTPAPATSQAPHAGAAAAGQSVSGGKADAASERQPQSLPVTAELSATFESVLTLIHNAESMDRLVRVASVRLLCQRDQPKDPKARGASHAATAAGEIPLLRASVGLEVIYDPSSEAETQKH